MDRVIPTGLEKQPEGTGLESMVAWPKVSGSPDYFSPYPGCIMTAGRYGHTIHVIDSVHHWLELTKRFAVAGGAFSFKDGADTPDTVSLIIGVSEELMSPPGDH